MGGGRGIGPTEIVLKDRSPDDLQQDSTDEDDDASETSSSYESDTSSSSSASDDSFDEPRPTALRRTSSEVVKPLVSKTSKDAHDDKEGQASEPKKQKGDVWIYVSDEREFPARSCADDGC